MRDETVNAIVATLEQLRTLIDAASDELLDDVEDDRPWEEHPVDGVRDLALRYEQELWEWANVDLKDEGRAIVFNRERSGKYELVAIEIAHEGERPR